METAAELRAEAQRLRTFATSADDPEIVAELWTMIFELERRTRKQENGGVC